MLDSEYVEFINRSACRFVGLLLIDVLFLPFAFFFIGWFMYANEDFEHKILREEYEAAKEGRPSEWKTYPPPQEIESEDGSTPAKKDPVLPLF